MGQIEPIFAGTWQTLQYDFVIEAGGATLGAYLASKAIVYILRTRFRLLSPQSCRSLYGNVGRERLDNDSR